MNAFENTLYRALYDVIDAVWQQLDADPSAPACNEALREAA